MTDILILNGPNLNMLGVREPEKYGNQTLEDIISNLRPIADSNNIILTAYQSNHEGEIIDRIHQAYQENVKFIIINPAAYTHTSISIRDALLAVNIKFIEVHLSNIYSRENYRHHSFLSDIAIGTISGLGAKGYELALNYALSFCNNN